jgi:hypothetical protein
MKPLKPHRVHSNFVDAIPPCLLLNKPHLFILNTSHVNFNPYPANVENMVKVKVTLVQALRLSTGRTAHRGSRGIALIFHDQRH